MAKFMRKHPDSAGTAYVVLKETAEGKLETLSLSGRDVYETDSKRIIETLRNDEAFVEVTGQTAIEPTPDPDGEDE